MVRRLDLVPATKWTPKLVVRQRDNVVGAALAIIVCLPADRNIGKEGCLEGLLLLF
jgi:hypothetical protein